MKKTIIVLGLALTLALIPGCSQKESSSDTPLSAEEIANLVLTEPGETVSGNNWLTYEYRGSKSSKAILQSRVLSVEEVEGEELLFMQGVVPNLDKYDVSIIRYEQRQVSGDNVSGGADYTDFLVADQDGVPVTGVTILGLANCETKNFPHSFGDQLPVQQCLVGAIPKSEDRFFGGLVYIGKQSTNPRAFDLLNGEPIFLKAG